MIYSQITNDLKEMSSEYLLLFIQYSDKDSEGRCLINGRPLVPYVTRTKKKYKSFYLEIIC